MKPDDPRAKLVKIIAPALRSLWADNKTLAIVAFDEEFSSDAKTLAVDPGGDTATIVNHLKSAVSKDKQKCLNLEGLGSFRGTIPEITKGLAAGKVVFVTGAAQGFGFEIAEDMACQGANVILADINENGAKDAAERINKKTGKESARGMATNVSDPESVAGAILKTVCCYGGIDVFVSNAGVLRAAGVREMSVSDFDLVTNVNYRGYFICVREAAGVMAVQHKAKPDYFSDIIQINSKSGLVGSNRNAAYAGSKFGGIGLTQSFALELVKDGIKVNSICPGNFFDGPLWSDPDNGLFVQYLRAGKVAGAKTIEDIRKAYESKIPMRRGCETADVMKAIYYLMEQKYETGQALPVTGGQVMLN